MLCDICNKNQATVHLTEIVDEQMNELHLCEECARKKSQEMEQQFGLSDLLAGMVEFNKPAVKEEPNVSVKCPNCGLTYADFKKIGRLGCGNCYVTFAKYLGPLLKRIHGSTTHTGKAPIKVAKPARKKAEKAGLQELRILLQKSIEAEAFEDAAKIRDQIRELERKEAERKEAK